jgi:hypothetical protein
MHIINVKHSLRDQATDCEGLGNGRRLEQFYPFLAPGRDIQVIRALLITCFRLQTHVTDGVIDVIFEESDVKHM